MFLTRRTTLALAAAAAALSLVGVSAQAQSTQADTIRNFYEVFNTGNADLLDEVLAEDWSTFPPPPAKNLAATASRPWSLR